MKEKVESFLITCREVLSLPRDLVSPKRSSKYLSSLFFQNFGEELTSLQSSLKVLQLFLDSKITKNNEHVAEKVGSLVYEVLEPFVREMTLDHLGILKEFLNEERKDLPASFRKWMISLRVLWSLHPYLKQITEVKTVTYDPTIVVVSMKADSDLKLSPIELKNSFTKRIIDLNWPFTWNNFFNFVLEVKV